MYKFNVTYEIVTPESAEHGDFEDAGFVSQGVSLRNAIQDLGCPADGIEASCYPVIGSGWITAYKVEEDYATGEEESRSLHFPRNLTTSSAMRIMRLLGVYGS